MLDGEEIVEIACGELRWEGARQHAERIGNRANILRRASPGGIRKRTITCGELRWEGAIPHAGGLAESFPGRGQDSMLDGEETVQIACESFAGRSDTACWTERKRGNSLWRASLEGSETACWTDRKPCKCK